MGGRPSGDVFGGRDRLRTSPLSPQLFLWRKVINEPLELNVFIPPKGRLHKCNRLPKKWTKSNTSRGMADQGKEVMCAALELIMISKLAEPLLSEISTCDRNSAFHFTSGFQRAKMCKYILGKQ